MRGTIFSITGMAVVSMAAIGSRRAAPMTLPPFHALASDSRQPVW
jgi:hypothetical protein